MEVHHHPHLGKKTFKGLEHISSVPENPVLISQDQGLLNSVIMKHQYYYGMLILMNQRYAAAIPQDQRLLEML